MSTGRWPRAFAWPQGTASAGGAVLALAVFEASSRMRSKRPFVLIVLAVLFTFGASERLARCASLGLTALPTKRASATPVSVLDRGGSPRDGLGRRAEPPPHGDKGFAAARNDGPIEQTERRVPETERASPSVDTEPRQESPLAGPTESVSEIFETAVEFVKESSRSLEKNGYAGVVIRLLIVIEVLIGALGFVSCITVWGKGKADLVLRIVDVMGGLFLFIALLIIALTFIS